jgi:allantoin racemase
MQTPVQCEGLKPGKEVDRVRPILLINPNANRQTTVEMVNVARASAPACQVVVGVTALRGATLIDDDAKLATGAEAVAEVAQTVDLKKYSGVIVSAFGDPGMKALRRSSPVPITGIAEAGMIEAAHNGRRFSIVTTTPQLSSAIYKMVTHYGFGELFTGLRLTGGHAADVMKNPVLLEASLALACEAAILEDAAEAIIIGGGPLAASAMSLRSHFSIPIIEPVPAAVRLALKRAASIESKLFLASNSDITI